LVDQAIAEAGFVATSLSSAAVVGDGLNPLTIMDALRREPALGGYLLLPSVRGDLLEKLGRLDEARGRVRGGSTAYRELASEGALLKRATACAAPQ
jgi:predicted RNA polymerase sigma factor